MGADDRESERRQIDPGLVAQHYECHEDDGEANDVTTQRRRTDCRGTTLRGARHDRGGGEEVHEHDAERDRRAGRSVPPTDETRAGDDDRRDHETAPHDVERDLALDERGYRFLCSHGLPSSSRSIWAR